jgi:ubiquitin carboxyl-terminal hydrolase L3
MALHKHVIPLESDPEIFTNLIHDLGASKSLSFTDVYSLDELALSSIPRPVVGLILAHPTPEDYKEEIHRRERATRGDLQKLVSCVWFQQTINNACGLYAILHAVSNGLARSFIGKLANSHNRLTVLGY